MSEPIKKPNQVPDSYSPKKPEIMNMMAEAQNIETNGSKTHMEIINAETPFKKSLDFNIRYNSLEGLNFIQRFTAVYMFLENIDGSGAVYCHNGGACGGCGGGNCITPTAVNKQSSYFFLFNTMSGNSSLRCHFDKKLTKMQKVIGDVNIDCKSLYGNDCGSDYTVDFLFGYVGYEYCIYTDENVFKKEIIASINARKPVIVKTKSGNVRFYVITGYDGDSLLCPDYCNVTYKSGEGNVLAEEPEQAPAYEDLESVYIIGGKSARRYTVKDGLYNIRQVMECNINEGVWDGYLEKLGGYGNFPSDDGFNKASPEEIEARLKRLGDTSIYVYNFVSFCTSICANIPDVMRDDLLYKELYSPELAKFWKLAQVYAFTDDIVNNAGHKFSTFFRDRNWITANRTEIPNISIAICGLIEKVKNADIKLLDIINQAIMILEK